MIYLKKIWVWVAIAVVVIAIYLIYKRHRQTVVTQIIEDVQTDTPTPENNNMQAFLAVIRFAEGTSGPDGYNIMYGGRKFVSFADHPRSVKCYPTANGQLCSDAAGAYQFLSTTWDEMAAKLDLPDFSPASQDAAAIQKIEDRGALDHVSNGDFETAIKKCAKEWASLPGSPYGQPMKTMAQLQGVFSANGGVEALA